MNRCLTKFAARGYSALRRARSGKTLWFLTTGLLISLAPLCSGATPPTDYPPRPVVSISSDLGLSQHFSEKDLRLPSSLLKSPSPKTTGKVDGALLDYIEKIRSRVQAQGRTIDGRALSTDRFRLSRTLQVQVYVRCHLWNEEARSRLESLGMVVETVANSHGVTVQGWIPYDSVIPASDLEFVTSIHPPAYPMVGMGSKTSESDVLLKTAVARLTYGVDGAGTRVGILSDSADKRSVAQATGDLPPDSSIYIGKEGSGLNEGTAMMEIVYDEAPGALLGFYGPETSLDMAVGIADMKNHGCNVISDDLAYLDQPCFEEGPIEQAINSVTAAGVVYLTCAANYARQHYTAPFNGVTANVLGATGVEVHNFGNLVSGVSSYLMPINLPANTTTIIALQWNAPWGYAADDYDLYLCDLGATGYYAKSDNPQSGAQYPMEIIAWDPGAVGGWAFLLVHRASGVPRQLKVYVIRATMDSHYQMPAGSIGFNNKAQNAMVVGAISAANFGGGTIEDFSGQGPVMITYPTATTWNKPDITGIDGVQVTGAGGFPVPFYGTSAASPAVAGVAALLRSAYPSATVNQVKAAITQSASDRGASGYDTVYGWGLADAVAAMQAAGPAYHLLYYASPTSATAGAPFATQPVVGVLDRNNALASGYSGSITVSIKPGTGSAGAVLSGTTLVPVTGGMAQFSGLSINLPGTGYVLSAAAPDAVGIDSAAFSVSSPSTPAKLSFVTQPGGTQAGTPLAPQPVVAAQDTMGLTVPSFTGPITLSIKPGTGAAGAVILGGATVNAVNGIATFNGLSIDKAGAGYVLRASSGAIPAADSNSFSMTASYPIGDLDKNAVFNILDLVLGARVLGGISQFPN